MYSEYISKAVDIFGLKCDVRRFPNGKLKCQLKEWFVRATGKKADNQSNCCCCLSENVKVRQEKRQ